MAAPPAPDMASEYLKWKYKDVTPDAPPPPLSPREKLINWLRYHWLWLVAGAAVLCVAGSMLWNVLGIGQVKPDYVAAYIGKDPLPEDAAQALIGRLESLGQDVNGDRRVTVELRQYATARTGEAETAYYYSYAADSLLLADITAADSYFFLVEDPDRVQKSYQILADLNGAPPADGDFAAMDKVYPLRELPAFADLSGLPELYLGRRCFYDEKLAAKQGTNEELWLILTKGATK